MLEGLADGRWALLTKVHHTMVDGIAGTDLLEHDARHRGPRPVGPVDDRGTRSRCPAAGGWSTGAIRESVALRAGASPAAARSPYAGGVATARAIRGDGRDARRRRAGSAGFARNARPTPRRRWSGRSGGTAGTGGPRSTSTPCSRSTSGWAAPSTTSCSPPWPSAFRDLLLAAARSRRPAACGPWCRCRCAGPTSAATFDNRVSAILAELPVELDDPHERLIEMAVRMQALKGVHEAQVGEQVTEHRRRAAADAARRGAAPGVPAPAPQPDHRRHERARARRRLYLAGRPMLATVPLRADRRPAAQRHRGDVVRRPAAVRRHHRPRLDAGRARARRRHRRGLRRPGRDRGAPVPRPTKGAHDDHDTGWHRPTQPGCGWTGRPT